MLRILYILALGLFLICPACRRGRMFRSRFVMNVRCPVCGVIFERDAGEVTGGMAINMTLTSLIAVVGDRHARGLWTSILYLTGSIFED